MIRFLAARNDSHVAQILQVGPTAGNGLNVSVFIEGNTTTVVHLASILFGDVDVNDTIQFYNRTVSVLGDLTYDSLLSKTI